ncbi:tRNA (guanosine(37)-N1)-methyltransferase TrmD [Roseovarius sp. LXJ103]|uniref:tRNA (guanosine(37)-N1)-methyltransferase TrmD n=1 Tax=Roseovarius carneus TaxID=2853164 RepID=UPI000D617114|nr:tRNA (guanosine(37)-N1)-methyltransferase TrmD [Roseovarius carneus]MBZ8118389.1 tRNA (guanosine(37)-N1)-methyltransferase TrmD [Roseovarius carneus]PWE37288.1 tRNA (guanosine(37)-N1)-methyltransferase TrmD [Pelagicola sp. LXJ1103]
MSDAPKPLTKSYGRKSIRANAQPQELITPTPRLKDAWAVQVITLLPEAFPGILGESLTGRALQDGLWSLDAIDLRRFGEGRHRNVDDTPAGGGAGMVLRADVMAAAIESARKTAAPGVPLIYLSPRGERFDQAMAEELSQTPGLTLICGRFEGLDQRVIDHYGAREVSLGDYVLTGGEIAAQAMIDAALRLRPGILGNEASAADESHTNGLLEHPQYTKPALWQGREIPPVLMSGHHGEIAKWRRTQGEALTQERRPDLWAAHEARSPAKPGTKRLK